MELADSLKNTLAVDCNEAWENGRLPSTRTGVRVRLHSGGLSLREAVAVFELLGVDCSHGAIWNRTHSLFDAQSDLAAPSWVTVDEK
jgi:hypothetical protein